MEFNRLINNPASIYSMDESGMPLDHNCSLNMLHCKGFKKSSSGIKAQITMLACEHNGATNGYF